MLTRAKVMGPSLNGKWIINIPILNGIPDDEAEGQELKNSYNVKISENSKLEKTNQKSNYAIVKESYDDWDTRELKFNGYSNAKVKVDSWSTEVEVENKDVINENSAEYFTEAIVCNIGGVSNLIKTGDIVIVGFEDNDMGRPIILGHLLTTSLMDKMSDYPNMHLNTLSIDNTANLPLNTKIDIPANNSNEKLLKLTTEDISNLWYFYKNFLETFGSIQNLNNKINSK